MFRDSNLILFLLCILPAIFYAVVMFLNSPSFSIRLKTSFTYLYTGLLSITLLQFIGFIFPHFQDTFFKNYEGGFIFHGMLIQIYQPTIYTLLMFAFIQVALVEEFSKWVAFKCVDYMRGKRRKNLDHPYATMFYSALISAAFSIVENIQYAQRAISGEFGPVIPESLLATRAITSVITHMACGLFMGYYIARSKGVSFIKKIFYNIIGISAAAFMHGVYDFNWMKPGTEKDYVNVFGQFPLHISSTIIICFSLVLAFLMSWQLKHSNKNEIKQP